VEKTKSIEQAMPEAIVNAVVHRDYSRRGRYYRLPVQT